MDAPQIKVDKPTVRQRILLSEDRKPIGEEAKEKLEASGYDVCLTQSPAEALVACKKTPPDFIIADYRFGEDYCGIDFLNNLPSALGSTPVKVLWTSYPTEALRELDRVTSCKPPYYIAKDTILKRSPSEIRNVLQGFLQEQVDDLLSAAQSRLKAYEQLFGEVFDYRLLEAFEGSVEELAPASTDDSQAEVLLKDSSGTETPRLMRVERLAKIAADFASARFRYSIYSNGNCNLTKVEAAAYQHDSLEGFKPLTTKSLRVMQQ